MCAAQLASDIEELTCTQPLPHKRTFHHMSRPWNHKLCSCFSDPSTCKIKATLHPCRGGSLAYIARLFALLPRSANSQATPDYSSSFIHLSFIPYSSSLPPLRPGILSFFVPCVPFGRNSEALGENCFVYGFSQLFPLLSCYFRVVERGRIREQKGLEGTLLQDILCTLCCYPCSLAQETRVNKLPA